MHLKKSHRSSFQIPPYSKELAEFCGIMLGDGGISNYQVIVTLNSIDDNEYIRYVSHLMTTLFGINPGIYFRNTASAAHVVISRIGVVEFLTQKCGLVLGNKILQRADIPQWIKENPTFHPDCIRGLVDTDGCIFSHTYFSKGKEYSYKKLSYTSVSNPLLLSAHTFLKNQGFNPRFGSNFDVRLDSKNDMRYYFESIGSHNPKHLNRYAT